MAKQAKPAPSIGKGNKVLLIVVILVIVIAVLLVLNGGFLTGLVYGGGDKIKLVNMTFASETIRVYQPGGLNETVLAVKLSLAQQVSQAPPHIAMKFYPDARLETPDSVYIVVKSLSAKRTLTPGSVVYYRPSAYYWYVDRYGTYTLDPVTKKYSITPVSLDLYKWSGSKAPFTSLEFSFANDAKLLPTSVKAKLKEETGAPNVINGQWEFYWVVTGNKLLYDKVFYGGGLRGGTMMLRSPKFTSFGESMLIRADNGAVAIQYAYNQASLGDARYLTN